MTGKELQLGELEPVDGQLVEFERARMGESSASIDPAAVAERNLAAEAERIAARVSTAGTRRQYASIYRSFATWLARELGRAPRVGDLDADVIAAYGRHLAAAGGRGGVPAAPATVRVYVSMIRALASQLGLKDQAAEVRVPRHLPGPLRSAELRRVRAEDLRRPRANARYFRLYVHGKGGRERGVSVPDVVKHAVDVWLQVHPLAKGGGLRDEQPLFVRLGRHGREQPEPLSAEAVYRLVNRSCLAAGIPDRLAHPHALRSYWATHLLEAGASIHEVSARLGHVDLRTTARYAAVRQGSADDLADTLDRSHQRAGRGW